MNIGDIYRITTTMTIYGQDCLNVDFKEIKTLPTNPLTDFEFARDYYFVWHDAMKNIISNDATFKSVLVENLTDGISFAQYDDNEVGVLATESVSTFVSAGIRLNRSTKITRNGYKRVAGLGEDQVSDNEVVSLPANKDLARSLYANTVVLDDLSNPPDTYECTTVIVGRTLNGSGVYELDLTKINPVLTATFMPMVTSQTSRKVPQ